MSFPNSPNNDIRQITMSPVPGSNSPNRNSGYNSDTNLHNDTIIMPPPVNISPLWIFLLFGLSNTLNLRRRLNPKGVKIKDTENDIKI